MNPPLPPASRAFYRLMGRMTANTDAVRAAVSAEEVARLAVRFRALVAELRVLQAAKA